MSTGPMQNGGTNQSRLGFVQFIVQKHDPIKFQIIPINF